MESLKYKLGISFIKGVGPNLAKNLIAYTGSSEGVFHEKQSSLEKIPGIGKVLAKEIISQRENALLRAGKEIEFIIQNNIQHYDYTDHTYPFRLKECPDAPLVLFGKGNMEFNSGKMIGIVGTRKITETGKENCRKLIFDLAEKLSDAVIISGLAYGVDLCAHKTALESGLPTIGILAHGLDRIYPGAHKTIAYKMLESGGLITEFPNGTNPDRPNFVQRNRIIAGMSDAVVVIESGEKGGALITANLANDYNRDVFAFPGRVTDEFSVGCNRLIKYNKAVLIESAEDMIRYMNWERTEYKQVHNNQISMFPVLTEEEEKILSILKQAADGIQINELSAFLCIPFSKVSSLLLELEFKNMVKCLPGNVYKIAYQ